MIHFTQDSCDLDVADALALLEFACTDKTTSLGVGICAEGNLCATDGRTLLVFRLEDAEKASEAHRNQVWSHAYVKIQVAVAKATKQPVRLMYSAFTGGTFPPVNQVIPEPGFGVIKAPKTTGKGAKAVPAEPQPKMGPVGFNPAYVGRIEKVCFALSERKNTGCQLVSMRGELDLLRFEVAANGRSATVVIMPMRI